LKGYFDAARAVIFRERGAGIDRIDRALGGALKADSVPDADGHNAGRPVPTVAIAGLEIARFRGVADLALFRRRHVEHDAELVLVAVGEGFGQFEQVGRQRACERHDFSAINQNPAGIVQSLRVQQYPLAGVNRAGGDRRGEVPVAVLNPFTGERVEAHVPVGQDAGVEQGLLDRARHARRDGANVGLHRGPRFHGLAQAPGMRPPAVKVPGQFSQIEFVHVDCPLPQTLPRPTGYCGRHQSQYQPRGAASTGDLQTRFSCGHTAASTDAPEERTKRTRGTEEALCEASPL